MITNSCIEEHIIKKKKNKKNHFFSFSLAEVLQKLQRKVSGVKRAQISKPNISFLVSKWEAIKPAKLGQNSFTYLRHLSMTVPIRRCYESRSISVCNVLHISTVLIS